MRISYWSSDVCSSDLEGATTMTTHRRLHALALALGLCLATAASAQTVGYNIRTGDVWVDNRLGEINDYGRYHRDPFIDEMHGYYGAPRPLLVYLPERPDRAPPHGHCPPPNAPPHA